MRSAADHKRLFTFPEVSGRGVGLWRSKPGGQVPPKRSQITSLWSRKTGGQVLPKRSQIASRRWPRADVAKLKVELKAKDDGGGGREGGR